MSCGHVDRKGRVCLRGFHADPIHVYTRLAQIGARKKRSQGAERAFRDGLLDRSDGFCEADYLFGRFGPDVQRDVCGTVLLHAGIDPHHLFPEDRRRGRHDQARGLWICRHAHDWTHDHPEKAHQLGLLRPKATHAEA